MNIMQLDMLIHTLLSPRKLWNTIQMWKIFRKVSKKIDIGEFGLRQKIMQERFEREVVPTLSEEQRQALKQPIMPGPGSIPPEALKALEELLAVYLGGKDVASEEEE